MTLFGSDFILRFVFNRNLVPLAAFILFCLFADAVSFASEKGQFDLGISGGPALEPANPGSVTSVVGSEAGYRLTSRSELGIFLDSVAPMGLPTSEILNYGAYFKFYLDSPKGFYAGFKIGGGSTSVPYLSGPVTDLYYGELLGFDYPVFRNIQLGLAADTTESLQGLIPTTTKIRAGLKYSFGAENPSHPREKRTGEFFGLLAGIGIVDWEISNNPNSPTTGHASSGVEFGARLSPGFQIEAAMNQLFPAADNTGIFQESAGVRFYFSGPDGFNIGVRIGALTANRGTPSNQWALSMPIAIGYEWRLKRSVSFHAEGEGNESLLGNAGVQPYSSFLIGIRYWP